MSLFSAIISFAVVAGLLTVIPGPDTALVLRAAKRAVDGVTGSVLIGFGLRLGLSR